VLPINALSNRLFPANNLLTRIIGYTSNIIVIFAALKRRNKPSVERREGNERVYTTKIESVKDILRGGALVARWAHIRLRRTSVRDKKEEIE
jgi:hypothetical protein